MNNINNSSSMNTKAVVFQKQIIKILYHRLEAGTVAVVLVWIQTGTGVTTGGERFTIINVMLIITISLAPITLRLTQ